MYNLAVVIGYKGFSNHVIHCNCYCSLYCRESMFECGYQS